MTADHRPKLLLVDDEPANLQVLRHVLQDDYRLLFARDGQKALELAKTESPQLVLLDIMMPGLSGLDVCRVLKSQPATKRTPVIFVTALADSRDETVGFAAGAVDYIAKPVSPPGVRARVRRRPGPGGSPPSRPRRRRSPRSRRARARAAASSGPRRP